MTPRSRFTFFTRQATRPSAGRLPSLALALALGLGMLMSACQDDDEIGTPCETAEDCSGDLVCDIHEGQGTCQEPHDH